MSARFAVPQAGLERERERARHLGGASSELWDPRVSTMKPKHGVVRERLAGLVFGPEVIF